MPYHTTHDLETFEGISSLEQIATPEDTVCVLNILGNESRIVTPISHAYSGGNVVFGTSAGRQGQVLKSKVGGIPIFDNVHAGLEAGYKFNTGVVYLPPNAVRDGVAELVRVNPNIRKIIILSEKVPVRAAREIRAICQARGVDVFGANCLGVADSWNGVRIGGALGGDAPHEVLRKGSIAIFSNSGNFTNTIATYLAMAGWGTTTLVSSGKDMYIHYGPQEFSTGLSNDARTKAAVMYIEPGGYYEQDLTFDKPVVACVVGKWKSNLTRAVGHAGALAGEGDDAATKEGWFLKSLDVSSVFTPENPVFSAKGAVVSNLSHIHLALNAVMENHGAQPDFEPQGGLELKPWFASNKGIKLPDSLNLPVVKAPKPYAGQVQALNDQLGAHFVRQRMKDCSGASRMDPKTQITRLCGKSVLELTRYTVDGNIGRALTKADITIEQERVVSFLVAAATCHDNDTAIAMARASADAGNSPNVVLSSALSLIGPKSVEAVRLAIECLIPIVALADRNQRDVMDSDFNISDKTLFAATTCLKSKAILNAVKSRGIHAPLLESLIATGVPLKRDAIIAALCTTLSWPAIKHKRISLHSAYNFAWMFQLIGTSIAAALHRSGFDIAPQVEAIQTRETASELFHRAISGDASNSESLRSTEILTGIVLSNGPGTISAQGAKGAVAADGPEQPGRVQLNKAMIGFLTHTGFSHGGNGYECVEFLLDQLQNSGLKRVSDPIHGVDLKQMAAEFAQQYKTEKNERKVAGLRARAIPGINHPVFRNLPINTDPREAYVSGLLKEQGRTNALLDFYKHLVVELHACGATPSVFCVNVDAVIACFMLDTIWGRLKRGEISKSKVETAAFNAFIFGRLIGCIAEIDDHLNRGKNMDTRTDASDCRFIA